MEQAIRTPRTAYTARPITSSSGRFVRLGTVGSVSSPRTLYYSSNFMFHQYCSGELHRNSEGNSCCSIISIIYYNIYAEETLCVKRKFSISSSLLLLSQASMLTSPDGPFINLSRLNLTKYSQKPKLAKVCTSKDSKLCSDDRSIITWFCRKRRIQLVTCKNSLCLELSTIDQK